jgi:Muconolactone delta-isomerase
MKFLLTVTPFRGGPVPPQAAAAMLSAQRDWIQARLDDGTLECAYAFTNGGGVGIVEVDSHEAMHELLLQSPSFPISEHEVVALADVGVALTNAASAMERIAAAMSAA